MERTEILQCNCSHEFQDQLYGKGMRVHNVNKKGKAACTVCTTGLRFENSEIPKNEGFGIKYMVMPSPKRILKDVPL